MQNYHVPLQWLLSNPIVPVTHNLHPIYNETRIIAKLVGELELFLVIVLNFIVTYNLFIKIKNYNFNGFLTPS